MTTFPLSLILFVLASHACIICIWKSEVPYSKRTRTAKRAEQPNKIKALSPKPVEFLFMVNVGSLVHLERRGCGQTSYLSRTSFNIEIQDCKVNFYKKTISNRSSFVRSQKGEGWRESNWPNRMVYLVLLLGKTWMSWLHSYLKNKKVSAISRLYDFATYKNFQPALSTRVITSIIGNRTLRPLDADPAFEVGSQGQNFGQCLGMRIEPRPRPLKRIFGQVISCKALRFATENAGVLKDRNHEIYVPMGHYAKPWRNQLAHDFHLLDLRPEHQQLLLWFNGYVKLQIFLIVSDCFCQAS